MNNDHYCFHPSSITLCKLSRQGQASPTSPWRRPLGLFGLGKVTDTKQNGLSVIIVVANNGYNGLLYAIMAIMVDNNGYNLVDQCLGWFIIGQWELEPSQRIS